MLYHPPFALRRPQRAATVYHTMLIIACVAMAVAVFFPVYEYMTLYRGPVQMRKFPNAEAPRVTAPAPAPTPAESAPKADTDATTTPPGGA